jgi:hypothetical protein
VEKEDKEKKTEAAQVQDTGTSDKDNPDAPEKVEKQLSEEDLETIAGGVNTQNPAIWDWIQI